MRLSHPHKAGFTLIELLIVVVIIGILAAIAIPRFQQTKGKTFTASIKSDLRNVAGQQENYFYDNEAYAANITTLNFDSSEGVVVTITEANARGWSASATHPAAWPLTCAVFYGQAAVLPPAETEGVLKCTDAP